MNETRNARFWHLLELSQDRLIFEGKQRGINCESMDKHSAAQAIVDYDDKQNGGDDD